MGFAPAEGWVKWKRHPAALASHRFRATGTVNINVPFERTR